MLGEVAVIVSVAAGIIAVIAKLYSFLEWMKKLLVERSKRKAAERIPPLSPRMVDACVSAQEQELAVWRLLDFRRDIPMMDIHVQEILEVISPLGRTKIASAPMLAGDIWSEIVHGTKPERRLLFIHGNAGSGKSTMLRHWALLLTQNTGDDNGSFPFPVYLSLRHIPEETVTSPKVGLTPEDLARCFQHTIAGIPAEVALFPFRRVEQIRSKAIGLSKRQQRTLRTLTSVQQLLKRRPLSYIARIPRSEPKPDAPEMLFLCDGLDEMPRERVDSFIAWIRALPTRASAVIATRPGLRYATNLPRSREFSLCSFNWDQIQTFVQQWFASDAKLGRRFLAEIEANESVREIVAIPLLLTFLSLDVEVTGDPHFPDNLKESDLLLRIMEILLERWDASKSARRVQTEMIQLGLSVYEGLTRDCSYGRPISLTRIEEEVEQSLSVLRIAREFGTEFLLRLKTGGQILQGSADSGYLFAHKIFFDFFFSRYIVRIAGEWQK